MKCYPVYGNTFYFCCFLKHIEKIVSPAVSEVKNPVLSILFSMGVFFCTR
jgi:hypothetical protein